MKKAAAWLKKSLSYEFNDADLLERALTHRSAASIHNERLEFLGDSVLQLVISELVFNDRPDAHEGSMSRVRASLVRDKTLGKVAEALGVGDYMILGPGEKKSGGHRRTSILADTMEAIFGAVYLDAGLDAAKKVIMAAYGERLRELPAAKRDPKSRLQELLQGQGIAVPDYSVVRVSGKAHRQTFEVECAVPARDTVTRGEGPTRRGAEQEAARAMLAVFDAVVTK